MAYQFPLNGGRINATITGNTAGVGSLVSTGTLSLAGGNNITLSQNGNAITISGANAPSGSINFSAGTTSSNLNSVVFSNSGGVSFGLNGGTITGTVATNYAASSHSHGNPTLNLTNMSGTTASASNGLTLSLSAAAQSNQNISLYALGNTTQNSSTLLNASNLSFNGLGGATVGFSNGSIQISGATGGGGGGGGGAVGRWEHPTAVFTTLPAIVNNSLSLQHVYMPFNFSGTEMKIGGSLSMGTHTSASTGSATINLKMGIYTLNGSTLSLLNSGSYSTRFGVSSNSTSSYNGMRQFAVTGSFNLSAGEYWVGAILSTATNYASNPLGYTVYGNSAAPTAASAAILSPFGSAVSASPRDVFLFQGMYGTTTTALPTAIQGSQINNSAASFVQRAQFYHAIYSATY